MTRDDPNRAACLACLSFVLVRRFDDGGEPGDLDEAVKASRAAMSGAAPHDPNHALGRFALGLALLRRFERSGANGHLDVDRPSNWAAHIHTGA